MSTTIKANITVLATKWVGEQRGSVLIEAKRTITNSENIPSEFVMLIFIANSLTRQEYGYAQEKFEIDINIEKGKYVFWYIENAVDKIYNKIKNVYEKYGKTVDRKIINTTYDFVQIMLPFPNSIQEFKDVTKAIVDTVNTVF